MSNQFLPRPKVKSKECITHLSRDRPLCQHIERQMNDTSVQENRRDEPPPLIGLFTMKTSKSTHVLDGAYLCWWIGSIIRTCNTPDPPVDAKPSASNPMEAQENRNVHPISVVSGICGTYRIHGGHRAPRWTSPNSLGPSIGFT